jgi:hypothetical protein
MTIRISAPRQPSRRRRNRWRIPGRLGMRPYGPVRPPPAPPDPAPEPGPGPKGLAPKSGGEGSESGSKVLMRPSFGARLTRRYHRASISSPVPRGRPAWLWRCYGYSGMRQNPQPQPDNRSYLRHLNRNPRACAQPARPHLPQLTTADEEHGTTPRRPAHPPPIWRCALSPGRAQPARQRGTPGENPPRIRFSPGFPPPPFLPPSPAH